MGRETIQLEDAVSTISGEYLLEFTSEYGIPKDLHPELPGTKDTIVDFPVGKSRVVTLYALNSQTIASPFYNSFLTSLDITKFIFYNSPKRPGKNTPQCYTKPLDSLKNWNNRFFCVDEKVSPTVVAWRTVGLSRRYFLGDDVYPTFLYDDDREMDLFNLISAPNPAKVKTGTRPRAAHEKSPLDFVDEDIPPPNTEGVGTEEHIQDELSWEIPPVGPDNEPRVVPETSLEEEVATMGPCVKKGGSRCTTKELMMRGKSLATMGLGAGSISSTPSAQGAPTAAKSESDPDPLSYAKPQSYPEQDIAQCRSFRGTATEIPTEHVATMEVNVQLSVNSPESGKSTFVPSVVGSPRALSSTVVGRTILRWTPQTHFLSQYNMNLARQVAMGSQLRLRFEQEVRLLKKARAKIARRDQRIQVREEEIKKLDQEVKSLRATETEVHGLRNQTKNLETLLEAEADMKKAAEAKNAELTKELESLRVRFSDLQVNNNQLSQQVSNLQAQITGEEKIKAAFEEFKKYEDARVEQRCAEMDARLDALSIDFDEELYPHMLTAIAGRRWVIGHGIRLAVMKCAESTKLRQVFANVVSAGIAKGMSEGLKYGIEHGKAGRDLVDVEAYDPEANDKLVKALQDLKDLKYPMVDQLERLKDAPMELIMASLHLEGDTGEDAPQRIRDLRPISSQLKIPVYPEVRNLKDPWAVKEEMLLEDAITANISQAEKKKKCRQMQTTEDKVDSSKALDASLVDTESSGTTLKEQDTNSSSGNDVDADDADIKPVYDKEPMAKVDQNAEQCHDIRPLPTKLTDNEITKL
ncbi:hypothetical protein Tco_1352627 [Tanacetum coccineum]